MLLSVHRVENAVLAGIYESKTWMTSLQALQVTGSESCSICVDLGDLGDPVFTFSRIACLV